MSMELRKFDSMKAAAAGLGLPLALLKRAKRLGCPAFRGGRVDAWGLKAWLAARKAAGLAPITALTERERLECARLQVQVERARFGLDAERRRYMPASEVEQWRAEIVLAARQRFSRLAKDLAPAVVGLDANQAAAVIEDGVRAVLESLADDPRPEACGGRSPRGRRAIRA